MPGSRYDTSAIAKAIHLVRGRAGDYPTRRAAITAVSGRLGMSAETLRKDPQAEVHVRRASAKVRRGVSCHFIE